jgi:hypothetical protein
MQPLSLAEERLLQSRRSLKTCQDFMLSGRVDKVAIGLARLMH